MGIHLSRHLKEEQTWGTCKQLRVISNLKQLYHLGTKE